MTDLKVGDRVRLSTGAQGVVDVVTHWGEFSLELPECVVPSQQLRGLGVTWEVIKPELVEPPYGNTIRFRDKDGTVRTAWSNSGYWLETLDQESYTWWQLIQHYRFTEFELLRPEKEVVKEVLDKFQGFVNSHTYARVQKIAKGYGVEL